MRLHTVKKKKETKKKKRLGRGYASGDGGHTTNSGQKGQKSRSGHKSMMFFEGGNTPLYKKFPKYGGFRNPNRKKTAVVNVGDLNKSFKSADKVTIKKLQAIGLIDERAERVKILGTGEVSKKLHLEGILISETATAKIIKKGGTVK